MSGVHSETLSEPRVARVRLNINTLRTYVIPTGVSPTVHRSHSAPPDEPQTTLAVQYKASVVSYEGCQTATWSDTFLHIGRDGTDVSVRTI